MLTYTAKSWEDSPGARGGYRTPLFSVPDHFRMTRGTNRCLRVASAMFPGMGTSVHGVASSGHEIDLVDDTFLTLMLPLRGVTRVRMERREQVIQEGMALALAPSARWTQVTPRNHRTFRAHLVKIDLGAAPHFRGLQATSGNPIVPTEPMALEGLRSLIRYLFADLSSPHPTLSQQPASDLFAALLKEHLRSVLATDPKAPSVKGARSDLVARALEYMSAHVQDPLTVPGIAEAVGAPTRHLQDAFRVATGQSPWEHLTAMRLERARALLLAGAGRSVTAIALDCGFSHLGRFAQAYRAAYHEPPSVTLGRSKREAGVNG
ncbi:AraC family transcriptional regulator [Sulfitobacter porphyrae]|nr:AraC family transcriptional regulator [Sulfitobacter porphyrae]